MSALDDLLLCSPCPHLPTNPNETELSTPSNLTYTRLLCSLSNYAPIPHSSNNFHLDQTTGHLSLPWPNRRRRTCFTRPSIPLASTNPHPLHPQLVFILTVSLLFRALRPSAALRTPSCAPRHGKPDRRALAAMATATVHARTAARDCRGTTTPLNSCRPNRRQAR